MREGGARYFEHPRSVALILIDECQLLDRNIIAAALLHDAQEDSSIFGSYSGRDYQSWNAVAYDRIKRIFNDEVAEIVTTLTKPPHEIPDVGTKENALNIYYENLYNASDKTILVKMADRLHNLRTLEDTSEEKQERKVQETEEHYLPLFQLVSIRNREARHMLGLINKQLTSLKSH